MEEREPFIVVHDYGMGGLWVLVHAGSPHDVVDRFRDLEVVDRPSWMDDEQYAKLDLIDLEKPLPKEHWLRRLEKAPNR